MKKLRSASCQVDTHLEDEELKDSDETFAESDAPDQGATPQNHLSLLNNDIPEEEVTIAPRPRRMRFDALNLVTIKCNDLACK